MRFLNLLIYGDASSGFMDITVGSSGGRRADGLQAVEGWDAATGLWTLNFTALRIALG